MKEYTKSKIDPSDINKFTGTANGRTHYNDLSSLQNFPTGVTQLCRPLEISKKIIMGSAVPCLHCGAIEITEEMEFACGFCGCTHECEDCGSFVSESDIEFVESVGLDVCSSCYHENYFNCIECGSLERIQNSNALNGHLVCDHCFIED